MGGIGEDVSVHWYFGSRIFRFSIAVVWDRFLDIAPAVAYVGNITRSFLCFRPPAFPICDRDDYFELLVFSRNLDGVFGYEICLH